MLRLKTNQLFIGKEFKFLHVKERRVSQIQGAYESPGELVETQTPGPVSETDSVGWG